MPRELSNIVPVNGIIEIFANEVVHANKPLIVKGGKFLKIICKGTAPGIILNKQKTQNGSNKYFLPSIVQDGGSNLTITNIIGEQQTWQNPQQLSQWDCNVFLKSNGGTKLQNFVYKEGYAFQLESGADLEWTDGGSWWKPKVGSTSLTGSPFKYGGYMGNADWDQSNLAKRVVLNNLKFYGTRKETNIRSEGVRTFYAKNCHFAQEVDFLNPDKTKRHNKEGVAFRLGHGVFENCYFENIEVGARDPNKLGPGDVYFQNKYPTYVTLINCQISGYCKATGKTFLDLWGGRCLGKDKRGISGELALSTAKYFYNGKTYKPVFMAKNYFIPTGMKAGTEVVLNTEPEWNETLFNNIWAISNSPII